jgi:hypothetical protein
MTPEVSMRRPSPRLNAVFLLTVLTSVVAAGAQEWNASPDQLRRACEKAGGPDKFPGAEAVVVFDRRDVQVESSGLSRTVQHTLRKALTASGARQLAVELLPYDPLSADVEVLRAGCSRRRAACGR